MRSIRKIGYDSGWGNKDYGCQDGPLALEKKLGVESIGASMLAQRAAYQTKESCLPLLLASLGLLKEAVTDALQKKEIPVVFGGDHTCAVATWSAVAEFYAGKECGLLWLDAHLDAHTAATAHEGKWGGWWHGMPIAALTGGEKDVFKDIAGGKQQIKPKNLEQIGIRSFEPAEEKYVQAHNIAVTYAQDIAAGGFVQCFHDKLERIVASTDIFGISIDLDGFDPRDVPGVGTPEEGGIRLAEALETLKDLGRHEKLVAVEIVEFNPHHDENNKTLDAIEKLLDTIFS
ncbi:MAG: arginase [Alphaproteobacteria bacterium]|nr:arginase [Alphaproteobacteria bacterium]